MYEGMENKLNYLFRVLVRRTPVFRTYFQEGIVSKFMMDVT